MVKVVMVAMERAEEFLKVAEMALEQECYNGCASNAYYAMFWAAIAALAHQGIRQTEWSHGGLREIFSRELIVKRQIYPSKFGEWLKDSYNLRVRANYRLQGASAKWSRRILEHAREFVNTVKEVVKR
ncbi:MAG: HEPN domain-containing protein [Armatimonadota bacterium]